MTNLNEVYKCNVCGNITEVIYTGVGTLVCCGQDMQLMSDESKPEGTEKHIPIVKQKGNKVKVKVGSIPHPMTEEHQIERIEVITSDKVYRRYLKPTDAPEAEFEIEGKIIKVREYCNLHGLWKA